MTRYLQLLILGLGFAFLRPAVTTAQGISGITAPAQDDTISGIVIITGTAVDPDFLRYELAFRQATNPDWIVFAQGDLQVADGTLAVWDTTVGRESTPVFPDGAYLLRLRVVRTDYNYDEYFVTNIVISNDEPTPTPSPTISDIPATPATDELLTLTPQAVGPLPSLTPFPTPQPRATPIESVFMDGDATIRVSEQGDQGLLDQLASIDTSDFGWAFWRGVRLVGVAFLALALYLILRSLFRRLWRLVQTKLFR